MERIKIRQASIEDIPSVAKVFRESREFALPYLPKLHTPEEDLNYFSNVVFEEQKICVAELSGRIVGFVAFRSEWIHHLYVQPESLGFGIGTRLLMESRKRQKKQKLWVFKKNEQAIRFYQKFGFHIMKETDGAENEEKEPDILMHWPDAST